MSDVTLSRSDLFLVLFAAIALARMVSAIAKSTITAYLLHRAQARIVKTMASGADMMANLSQAARAAADEGARARVNVYDRDTLDEVRVIQEGAFLAGWREAERCRSLREESEDHVMHHFQWRDAAAVKQKCERAGAGACNKLHPATGDICARPPGHDGPHSHGILHWTDDDAARAAHEVP